MDARMSRPEKNAPAAGGHQREGEDQNPYERNQIMSDLTHTMDRNESSEVAK